MAFKTFKEVQEITGLMCKVVDGYIVPTNYISVAGRNFAEVGYTELVRDFIDLSNGVAHSDCIVVTYKGENFLVCKDRFEVALNRWSLFRDLGEFEYIADEINTSFDIVVAGISHDAKKKSRHDFIITESELPEDLMCSVNTEDGSIQLFFEAEPSFFYEQKKNSKLWTMKFN